MPNLPKRCAQCGESFDWFEAECPHCHVALADDPDAGPAGTPDLPIVTVFQTTDPGLLPLARLALEAEGIDYEVVNEPRAGVSQVLSSRYYDSQKPMEIVVAGDVAADARAILSDLAEQAGVQPVAPAGVGEAAASGPATVRLEDGETGRHLGDISEIQLEFLLRHLEQESADDRDFYIDPATIEMLADRGASAALVDVLRQGLGDREGMDVRVAPRA